MSDLQEHPVAVIRPEEADAFFAAGQHEADSTFWGFRVVRHEQTYALAVRDGRRIVGAALFEIAAALARVRRLVVLPECRRLGIGRAMVTRMEEMAKYYNCHKVTLEVPKGSAAEAFFVACGYRVEATLAQHAFKLDVDILRKFLI